jgi:hypothetical protein
MGWLTAKAHVFEFLSRIARRNGFCFSEPAARLKHAESLGWLLVKRT